MGNIVSNDDIMKMFRDIDDFKESSDLLGDELDAAVLEQQDKIIRRLSFLVYSHTRMYRRFPNHDDLAQEGFIGLLKAVRKFDHNRFPNFFVWSNQWIRHYVKHAASRFDIVYNPNKSRVVYFEPEESETETKDTPEEIFFDQERRERIDKILDEFPEREKKIVQKIFGLSGHMPETLREIGPQFNLTHERIRQIKNNVIAKLKKNCKLNEFNQN